MRWVRYIAIAIVNGFGVVIGIIWVAVPATVAQPSLNYQLAISGRQPDGETGQSLSELYKLRDRLKVQLDNLAKTPDSAPFSVEFWKSEIHRQQSQTLTQQLQNVQTQIQIEEIAKNNWDEAAKLAAQAVEIGRTSNPSSATWEQSQRLWQRAIDTLRLIPHGSFLTDRAIDKTIEYQGNLTVATYELQVARSVEKIRAEEEEIRERARKEQEKKELARREIERKEQEKKEQARKELERQEFQRQELARKELERQELERNQQATPQPTTTPTPGPVTFAASPSNFFFAGDTNRDGQINEQDEAGKEQWSLSKGALILFNDRNNDRGKIPTWKQNNLPIAIGTGL